MRTRPQNISILIAVITLAAALTLAASGSVLARSTFQSIVPSPEITETVPPGPTFTPGLGDGIPQTQTPFLSEMTPTATLVAEATPTMPLVSDATPTASGFLPPPTLVNPSSAAPGRLSPLAPENRPLVGAAEPFVATATPTPLEAPSAAQLIDSGVVALSYLWLCCGALLLAAAALVIVWLSRRSNRR